MSQIPLTQIYKWIIEKVEEEKQKTWLFSQVFTVLTFIYTVHFHFLTVFSDAVSDSPDAVWTHNVMAERGLFSWAIKSIKLQE